MAHSQSIDRKSRNLLVGLAVFLALIHVQIPGLFAAPIESRSSMRIPVRQGTKWGYIDGTGKLVIPFQFDHAFGFSEGLAQVEIDGKCGFIGVQGDLRITWQNGSAVRNATALWQQVAEILVPAGLLRTDIGVKETVDGE